MVNPENGGAGDRRDSGRMSQISTIISPDNIEFELDYIKKLLE